MAAVVVAVVLPPALHFGSACEILIDTIVTILLKNLMNTIIEVIDLTKVLM